MSAAVPSAGRTGALDLAPNPFSGRAALAIVVLGGVLFVALLWLMASGRGFGSINDGKAHAGSKGLTGYAAVADYLGRRGFAVSKARNEGALDAPGLLVLTPPFNADGEKLARVVARRRRIGPTIVITPKWLTVDGQRPGRTPRGWVDVYSAITPRWRGFLDDLSVGAENSPQMRWRGAGLAGPLASSRILAGGGTGLVRIVATADGRHTLAGYLDDGGTYPGLEAMAMDRVLHSGRERGLYPLVVVFEPDLLDNYGMARFANARLAERLVRATGVRPGERVTFDLTFNGLGGSVNLLTLAFSPPFLAVTLCLLLAAAIAVWRGFLRFGPPLVPDRAVAFGKQALVANAAGLVRRSGRLRLLGPPYADRAQERLRAALGLPRALDAAQAGEAIDRMVAARDPQAEPFTRIVARLRAARRSPDLVKAARDLHALERKLIP